MLQTWSESADIDALQSMLKCIQHDCVGAVANSMYVLSRKLISDKNEDT
jgi:hypothetical protein